MATASAIGGPVIQLFDNNGNPAASYQLFIYTAGTTTKATTWSDVNEATPNANPIILDSAGRCTVFLSPGSAYKFVLATPTDTDPPSSPVWTRDNIQAVPLGALTATDVSVTATAGEALTAGQVVYQADGSGGTTAGRWYKADPANTYSSTSAGQLGMVTASIGSGSTGVVLKDGRVTGLSGLVAGTLYYINTAGALTSSAPTNARPVGVAESSTVLVFGPWAGTMIATGTIPGSVSISAQTIAGVKTFSSAPILAGPATYNPGGDAAVDATMNGILQASVDSAQHANSGTGETTLSTYTLPANVLSVNGKMLRITAWGNVAANGNNKIIKIYFGANAVAVANSTFTSVGTGYIITGYVIRTGATAQKTCACFVSSTAGVITSVITASPTETLSGTVVIKTTGQSNTASSDIVQEGFFVEVLG